MFAFCLSEAAIGDSQITQSGGSDDQHAEEVQAQEPEGLDGELDSNHAVSLAELDYEVHKTPPFYLGV